MNTPLLTADTPVHLALRKRPRLAEPLAAFGAASWERPQATLKELFRNRDTLENFLAMAATLPVPDDDTAWNDCPAAYLADHLTQHHRDFFNVTLPDIAGIFGDWDSLDPEITELRDDFNRFSAALRHEAELEETQFFPRVLRYDACLQDPRVNPEFNGGSLRVAVAYRRAHAPGGQAGGLHPAHLDRIVDRLGDTHAYRDGNTWAELLAVRLGDFRRQFEEHERLENDVLYPLALDREATLYNLSIAGFREAVVGA